MSSTSNPKRDPHSGSNTEKSPDDWVTGEEPMTGAQASYLKTLCEETGETFDSSLSKAEASRRIDELQARDRRLASSDATPEDGELDEALEDSFPASDPPSQTAKGTAGEQARGERRDRKPS
jgi:Protein of unknown function (DUF3072)